MSSTNTFEFTQSEIKKPAPPITSILDFINGDGSDGVAPPIEVVTTKEEAFHSLVPVELTTPLSPPWENDSSEVVAVEVSADQVQSVETSIDDIKSKTENELIVHWLQTNGYHDEKEINEEVFNQAMDWAKSFVSSSNATDEAKPTATEPTETVEQVPSIMDFEMTELAEPTFEPTEPQDNVTAVDTEPEKKADYAKLYDEAIDKWKEDCFRAESDYKTRLEKLKKDQTDAAIAIEKAGEVVKETKKIHKAIMQRLMNALDSGATFPDKPSMPEIVKLAKESSNETTEVTKEIATDGTVTVKKNAINEDTRWRTVPTATVLAAVKEGLGPKKRELIIDNFPTLGDLTDARIEASKAYKNFSEFLPEGIGKELTGRIEDAMLAEEARHWPDIKSM